MFLRASRLDVVHGALDVARACAAAVARIGRSMGACRCHGLAGSVEFLLDVARATHDEQYSDEARAHGRLLTAFARESSGAIEWNAGSQGVLPPERGYLLGDAGITPALIRLSAD